MQLTPHFHIDEFRCKDGTPVPEKLICNVQVLAANLETLREDLNVTNRPKNAPANVPISLPVNSGYRTTTYNKKVGGKPGSKHLTAEAGDITCKWESPKQLAARIERLIKAGKMREGGLGVYPGFVHYDTRGTKARW